MRPYNPRSPWRADDRLDALPANGRYARFDLRCGTRKQKTAASSSDMVTLAA
jgi:hypothetical protein